MRQTAFTSSLGWLSCQGSLSHEFSSTVENIWENKTRKLQGKKKKNKTLSDYWNNDLTLSKYKCTDRLVSANGPFQRLLKSKSAFPLISIFSLGQVPSLQITYYNKRCFTTHIHPYERNLCLVRLSLPAPRSMLMFSSSSAVTIVQVWVWGIHLQEKNIAGPSSCFSSQTEQPSVLWQDSNTCSPELTVCLQYILYYYIYYIL